MCVHYICFLSTERHLSPNQMAELLITQLLIKAVKLNMMRILSILFLDEIGQLSVEILSVLDIILRRIRDNSIFLRGILVVTTLDHAQLQPMKGRPFLRSSHDISCFKMIKLSNSVKAYGDAPFLRIQEVFCMYYNNFEENPELLEEFKELLSGTCTFVDD